MKALIVVLDAVLRLGLIVAVVFATERIAWLGLALIAGLALVCLVDGVLRRRRDRASVAKYTSQQKRVALNG